MLRVIALGMSLLLAVPAWTQTDSSSSQEPVPAMVGLNNNSSLSESPTLDASDDRMTIPAPVSTQAYPIALASEERSNYLLGGVSFTGDYSDNALGLVNNGHPVRDESYSIASLIALDEKTSRLHFVLTYAPGFTFYQHTSTRNEADQNASIRFEYRLSPGVSLSASDSVQKSSNAFSQVRDLASGGLVSGGAQNPNFSVIAPIADRLSNVGRVGLNYQYDLNEMVGISGTFTNLSYQDPALVRGLYDSSSQGGLAFYSRRINKAQQVGVTYAYERLVSYRGAGTDETSTHAALLFYTISPSRRFSMSFFGGPQYAKTVEFLPATQLRSWMPVGGVSLGWQGRLNTVALSYTHIVAGGGGLVGAVQLDSATASVRQQITRLVNVSASAGYSQNNVLNSQSVGLDSGHSLFGNIALQQQLGQHLNAQIGFSKIHQSYSNIQVITLTPDTNRAFASISYQFSKALGR